MLSKINLYIHSIPSQSRFDSPATRHHAPIFLSWLRAGPGPQTESQSGTSIRAPTFAYLPHVNCNTAILIAARITERRSWSEYFLSSVSCNDVPYIEWVRPLQYIMHFQRSMNLARYLSGLLKTFFPTELAKKTIKFTFKSQWNFWTSLWFHR